MGIHQTRPFKAGRCIDPTIGTTVPLGDAPHFGTMSVSKLLAYEEIRQLAYRYALAIDSRDLDTLVALFVPDVRVGREARGREVLRADFDRQLHAVGVTILHVTNHIIELTDEATARGAVYCRGEIELDEQWIHQAILYEDDYARRDDTWLFVRRRHKLWYGVPSTANPRQQPPADWPRNQVGRGTLPEEWETWRDFWRR